MLFKRKIITDIHFLSLKRWILINEKNDLSFLYEKIQPVNKKDNIEKVFEELNNQVFDIIGVDLKLISSWSNFLTFSNIYRLRSKNNEIINTWNNEYKDFISKGEIEKQKTLPNPTNNFNDSFSEYLNVLQEYYKDFEVLEYSLIADFEIKFKEFYNIDYMPKEVLNNLTYRFYTVHQFYGNLDKITDTKILGALTSKEFYSNFIDVNTVKINDLQEYHLSLQKSYQNNKAMLSFRRDKRLIFDLQTLKRTPKNTSNIADDVAKLNEILGYQINQETTNVAEFYRQIKQLENRPKQTSENPKPQSS